MADKKVGSRAMLLDCPGSLRGHVYEAVKDKMSCIRCSRITKYNSITRSWDVIQK